MMMMKTTASERWSVDKKRGPDEHGRFLCLIDGYMVERTLEQIKEHVARGGRLEEWKR